MKRRLGCYLRPYRLRWGFTQQELAFLIGAKRRKYIAYLEGSRRNPRLSVVFALHVVFGTRSRELFPGLCAEVEDAVIARAYDLYERLQGNPSKTTRVKLDFLEEMFARARKKKKGKRNMGL
jgi:transcriptional regulator with XRE-family HTH domain